MAVCPRCDTRVKGQEVKCINCGKTNLFVEDIIRDFQSAGTVTSRFLKCACGHFPRLQCGSCGANIHNESILPPIKDRTGRFCFVVTACYGSEHIYGQKLRRYRDETLLNYAIGRAFICLYERVGPSIAAFIENRPLLKCVARRVIGTVVRLLHL